MIVGTFTSHHRPKGYQQLTVSSTAVGLTVPGGASMALIKVIGQPVRYRDDGTDPDTDTGYPKVANDEFVLTGDSLKAAKFIRDDASDATLEVLYYAA